MAVPAVAAPAAQAQPVAAAPAAPAAKTSSWVDSHNQYCDWTNKNGFDVGSCFKIKNEGTDAEVDGLLTKIAKVFANVIASVLLLPVACVGYAFTSAKDYFCGKTVTPAQPNAPPAEAAPVANAAAAAGVAPAAGAPAAENAAPAAVNAAPAAAPAAENAAPAAGAPAADGRVVPPAAE